MRIPLEPTSAFEHALLPSSSASAPPLVFLDNEPFLVELQGALELPNAGQEGTMQQLAGASVGKIDLDDPHKPILRISHHRLEGKLVILAEPYAILRSTPSTLPSSPPTKRPRLSADVASSSPIKPTPSNEEDDIENQTPPKIEIIGLVRKKLVFAKRPEPLIELSSDLPLPPTSDPPIGQEDHEGLEIAEDG